MIMVEFDLRVVTFGEIMMRLSPSSLNRFIQARSLDVIYGGAEANVAVSLTNYGITADFVTRLPPNEIGDACLNYLRQFGVNTGKIIRGGDRLGIYYLEIGAVHRGNKVIYDRANSAIATIERGMINWEEVFSGVEWFHWTGITPALSQRTADVCLDAVKTAKEMGLTVSCDLNFRSKLWNYGKTAGEVMSELVKYVDVVIGNEEDADKVFGIKAPDVDVVAGKIEAEKYLPIAEQLMKRFPNLSKVATTLRGSISASHNTWSGVLYDGNTLYKSPTYQITHIVDRVGGGDAFTAGLIYGFIKYEDDLQKALNFAVAASCLKHTVFGDFNMVSVTEVEKLMKGVTSGRIQR